MMMIDRVSDFVDNNLRAIRILPWVIGSVGAFLIVKHTHAFHQFRGAGRIPTRLIQQNKTLSGVVVKCYGDSVGVWHVPIGRRIMRWKTKPPNSLGSTCDECLVKVKFSGVALSVSNRSQDWLKQNLTNQSVRFVLLHYDAETDSVESLVYCKEKRMFGRNYNVNQAIISTGNGSITDTVRGFKTNEAYAKFVTQISKKEMAAQRKGKGMWQGTDHVTFWRRLFKKRNDYFTFWQRIFKK